MESTAEFLERLSMYGADMPGIRDRFMDDEELYQQCFDEFLAEASFEQLKDAMASCEYTAAFDAAHALKGLSANLGLTPFYTVLCVLVESLRAEDYRLVDAQYRNVLSELHVLEDIRIGKVASPPEAAGTARRARKAKDTAAERTIKQKMRRVDRRIAVLIVLLLAGVLLVSWMLYSLTSGHRSNATVESADHLTEISYQISLYIAEEVENDWQTVHSLADGFLHFSEKDGQSMRAFMRQMRATWEVSNIILYTEDGFGVNMDGEHTSNDDASKLILEARRNREYMSIVQSTVSYTVPVETELRIDGGRVAAISVVQQIESFLDHMEFSSFDGNAYMYLTQTDGTVVSKLTHPDAPDVYNVIPLIDGTLTRSLDGSPAHAADMFASDTPTAYLSEANGREYYVVSAPVHTRRQTMRLFYFVPEDVVNRTSNEFSHSIVLLSVVVIVLFAAGALAIFILVYRARKRAFDHAIVQRDRMFDLLVRNTSTAFGLVTAGGREPSYASSNTEAVLGEKHLLLEKTPEGYRVANDTGVETDVVRQINHELIGWNGESELHTGYIRRSDAHSPGYFVLEIFPVNGADEEYVYIVQDATQTYAREEATRNALAMAERANAAKSSFLSNMSHDIRTPMNAIINMTDFAIESGGMPKKTAEYLTTIRESAGHLLRLINDVLDMSRIESGQAVVENEPFDLRAEMEQLCGIAAPLANAKRQTFLSDFSKLQTAHVMGDRVKVSQIFMNLLSNAIKFTPEGGAIRFSIEETPSLRADMTEIRIVVEDNGIGISRENLVHIFEPFTRADDRRIDDIEGTGLGLSICHSYVNAMGGSIACRSEEGDGSVFTVDLFFVKAQDPTVKPKAHMEMGKRPFSGMHCLLCEDNHVNQNIAKTILERTGFLVEIAENGRDGVARFRASRPGYFDVIYMDVRMPIMDGYEATAAIRESDHPQAATIPIIAMTANVFAEDIERARVAGMNAHLGKPIIVLDLIDETYKLLHREGDES